MSLLLPALNSAKEKGRETLCRNNLRQLAMSCQAHTSTYGYYPTGGWGWGWFGDPNYGSGITQPGGWIFNLLPYLDQQNLHDLQKGLTGAAEATAASNMLQTPTAVINCPSRRPLQLYPTWLVPSNSSAGSAPYRNACMASGSPPLLVAKSDYAGNAGDYYYNISWSVDGSEHDYNASTGPGTYNDGISAAGRANFAACAQVSTGVIYAGSQVMVESVTDGLSNTYMLGEKFLPTDHYFDGQDGGDNENAYMGFNEDICRFGNLASQNNLPPMQDTAGMVNNNVFGSCHPDGFGMAFCDASVHTISYSIDIVVHTHLSNRKDGAVIDQSQY